MQRIAIESAADPRLDDVRDLNRSDRHGRDATGKGLVIAEGHLVVLRLCLSLIHISEPTRR